MENVALEGCENSIPGGFQNSPEEHLEQWDMPLKLALVWAEGEPDDLWRSLLG